MCYPPNVVQVHVCLYAQSHIDRHSRGRLPLYLFAFPFASSFATSGIGIGPPGELSSLAVKTSTPVSVTSIVCSTNVRISI